MNWFDRMLSLTPPSDATWHCPWFRLIEYFATFGIVFGLISYFVEDSHIGLIAVFIGFGAATFTFGTRRKDSNTC